MEKEEGINILLGMILKITGDNSNTITTTSNSNTTNNNRNVTNTIIICTEGRLLGSIVRSLLTLTSSRSDAILPPCNYTTPILLQHCYPLKFPLAGEAYSGYGGCKAWG